MLRSEWKEYLPPVAPVLRELADRTSKLEATVSELAEGSPKPPRLSDPGPADCRFHELTEKITHFIGMQAGVDSTVDARVASITTLLQRLSGDGTDRTTDDTATSPIKDFPGQPAEDPTTTRTTPSIWPHNARALRGFVAYVRLQPLRTFFCFPIPDARMQQLPIAFAAFLVIFLFAWLFVPPPKPMTFLFGDLDDSRPLWEMLKNSST